MKMRKDTLTKRLYDQVGLSKQECKSIVESTFEIIKDQLTRGNEIKISGFGKWSVKSKRARPGRNPQTGKKIKIDARKVITFKPSPVLRRTVNSGD